MKNLSILAMACGCQICVLCTALGHLLALSSGLATPRISFPLGSPNRPLQDFQIEDISNAVTLLLSKDESTLFVGARDAVLSLDVSQPGVFTMKTKMEWKPTPRDLQMCYQKARSELDCQNLVRVLQHINTTHLYACGSYAYNPHDTYIVKDSLTMVKVPHNSNGEARGRCPFNPFQRSTAITIDGELFTGTTSDFWGKKAVISRHLSIDGRPDVNLDKDTPIKLLDEPTFVGASTDPADRKVYFFFSEVGKEYSFPDELRVSRVAQVCKGDIGGIRTLQKSWTSFAKAQLLCQPPKDLPFGLIQDIARLQPAEGASTQEMLFYGLFTSQWSPNKSAVCVFGIKKIKAVFNGIYKEFNKESHQWNPSGKHYNLGRCGLRNASDSILTMARLSFLASDAVTPVGGAPVLVSPDQHYSRVAVLRTQAANGKDYTVLFLLSESGWLHKIVLLDGGHHIIEEIQVFRQPQPMANILLSTAKGVVFVGTSERVTKVSVTQCPLYTSCAQCVLARDPFCGWDHASGVCARVSTSLHFGQDVEHGNVSKECGSYDRTMPDPEKKYLSINARVRLDCSKPTNLATLIWKSPKWDTLPEDLFFQSREGSLVFFATYDTEGTYHCVSVEWGFQETIANYIVSLSASPRSIAPQPVQTQTTSSDNIQSKTSSEQENSMNQEHANTMMDIDEVDENINLEEVLNPITPVPTPHLPYTQTDSTTPSKAPDTQTHRSSIIQSFNEPQMAKSYHSELIAVSFLLAVCVCVFVLAGLYGWRQRRTFKLGDQVKSEGESLSFEVSGVKPTTYQFDNVSNNAEHAGEISDVR
ncbi:semaphorin-4A-like [Osmerus mordax]|uniref:semaphorin-4A-like n=1 Tax=Osmerus mordax TaxID=8014 RepID=UPI00350FA0AB